MSQIEKIKKNPLGILILTHGVFYYCGAFLANVSFFVYIYGGATALVTVIPAAAFIYVGTRSPNILKGYKSTGNWKYGIIKISE